METINQENLTYKGTRILLGNEKRILLNSMIEILHKDDFQEISIPIIQYQDTFANKVGEENNNLMFNFKDRGDRNLCLAPEYTAVIQKLSNTTFKHKKNVKLFYIQECFRGEKPQAGRYRQFTQLGVEILNPTEEYIGELSILASNIISLVIPLYKQDIKFQVKRGLDYYKEGSGFEISCGNLGSSKQICGGGAYDGGIGFAIGVDRLLIFDKE